VGHRVVLDELGVQHAVIIGCVAAGPLENFISDNEDDLRSLETNARDNENLRKALRGVWVTTFVSPETLARLYRAAGAPLPRPRR
jgi:hypothetical protein